MTADEVLAQLTGIFREVFDDDTITPTREMVAADVTGWDSLGHVRLVVEVERHFGISFTSAEIGGWPNVGAFVDAIQRRLT